MGNVLKAAGSVLTAYSQLKEGKSAKKAGKAMAAQYREKANSSQATGQRLAIDTRRAGRLLASRAQAVAAASGGGAADVSVIDQIADIDEITEYQALSRLYEGDTEARSLRMEAEEARRQGKAANKAAKFGAAGTLLSGFGGLLGG